MCAYLLSGDWGTTHCRLRLVERDDVRIVAEVQTADGVQALADGAGERAARFRACLGALVMQLQAQVNTSLAGTPILLSGMVGATIGWHPVPYTPLPVHLDGRDLTVTFFDAVELSGTALPVAIISGLATPHEMLRGEEVEAIGILRHPAYAALRQRCLLLLPGTHAKHLRIEGEAIVDFTTHMTGELLAVLSQHSILRHSLPEMPPALWPEAFRAGLDAGGEMPLTQALFAVRARQVLRDEPPAANYSFLLGVLLGTELRPLQRWTADGWPLLLGAGPHHALAYGLALEHLGLAPHLTSVPAEVMRTAVVTGHCTIAEQL